MARPVYVRFLNGGDTPCLVQIPGNRQIHVRGAHSDPTRLAIGDAIECKAGKVLVFMSLLQVATAASNRLKILSSTGESGRPKAFVIADGDVSPIQHGSMNIPGENDRVVLGRVIR